jgi:hypothetical protein
VILNDFHCDLLNQPDERRDLSLQVRRRSDLDAVEWGPFGGRRYVEHDRRFENLFTPHKVKMATVEAAVKARIRTGMARALDGLDFQ